MKGLARAGISADAIHGNKSQNHRERVLAAFRSGAIRTLVATDIAARGIDVDGISHVVNFDLPNVPETYVHRIGRTARAGAEGVAISLIAGGEELAISARHRKADPHCLAQGRPPHAGSSRPDAGATPHRGGRSAPRVHAARVHEAHAARVHEAAPGSKGPHRRRRPGGRCACSNQPARGRPARSGASRRRAGQGGRNAGRRLLHRESRPNHTGRNRNPAAAALDRHRPGENHG